MYQDKKKDSKIAALATAYQEGFDVLLTHAKEVGLLVEHAKDANPSKRGRKSKYGTFQIDSSVYNELVSYSGGAS